MEEKSEEKKPNSFSWFVLGFNTAVAIYNTAILIYVMNR